MSSTEIILTLHVRTCMVFRHMWLTPGRAKVMCGTFTIGKEREGGGGGGGVDKVTVATSSKPGGLCVHSQRF